MDPALLRGSFGEIVTMLVMRDRSNGFSGFAEVPAVFR